MEGNKLRRVGRLGKPWGNRGELSLQLDHDVADAIAAHGWVFLDIDGQHIPFPVKAIEDKGRHLLIELDEVGDPQAAAALTGHDVLVGADLLPEGTAADLDPTGLVGMRVHDERHGDLGEVTGITGTDDNPVLVIHDRDREVLVPAVQGIVVAVDAVARRIDVRTPDGLVELYRP